MSTARLVPVHRRGRFLGYDVRAAECMLCNGWKPCGAFLGERYGWPWYFCLRCFSGGTE